MILSENEEYIIGGSMNFFLNDEISEQVEAIIRSLKKLMDGEISQKMRKKGIDYRLNYGASILWLRNLSQKYVGSNALAERLWLRDIRETKILATLIAVPSDEFYSVVKNWTKELSTEEMSEQLAVNLLWKFSALKSDAFELLNSQKNLIKGCVWVALSTFLQKKGSIDAHEIDGFIQKMRNCNASDHFILRCKGRFLRSLCRTNSDNVVAVQKFIDELKVRNHQLWLVEDVQTEIDYLKGT